ncbi:hypothetical protein BD309DRAFT_225918 [Dichomitus squalens]|nr:hypothetical protein BD309DRAFT_225918 [Dichomitus squalens]
MSTSTPAPYVPPLRRRRSPLRIQRLPPEPHSPNIPPPPPPITLSLPPIEILDATAEAPLISPSRTEIRQASDVAAPEPTGTIDSSSRLTRAPATPSTTGPDPSAIGELMYGSDAEEDEEEEEVEGHAENESSRSSRLGVRSAARVRPPHAPSPVLHRRPPHASRRVQKETRRITRSRSRSRRSRRWKMRVRRMMVRRRARTLTMRAEGTTPMTIHGVRAAAGWPLTRGLDVSNRQATGAVAAQGAMRMGMTKTSPQASDAPARTV